MDIFWGSLAVCGAFIFLMGWIWLCMSMVVDNQRVQIAMLEKQVEALLRYNELTVFLKDGQEV